MPVMIELSPMYFSLTDDKRSVPVEATTVGDALSKLTAKYGKLGKELYNGRGEKKENVSIYVNGRDTGAMDGLGTTLQNGDVVTIVPLVGYGRKFS